MASVVMPDGVVVEMPDNPTPAQLKALHDIHPDSGVMGYLKTTVHGLVKGALDVPSIALDNFGQLQAGADMGAMAVAQSLTGNKAEAKKSQAAAEYFINNPNQRNVANKKVDQLANFVGQEPATPGQRFVNSVAAGAGGAVLGPGNVYKNMLIGGSAGAGSEAAVKMLQEDNPITRVAGAVVGGMLPIVAGKLLPFNANKVIKTSVGSMSDADWKNAHEMSQYMKDQGMVHSNAQVLGPNSTLADVFQKATENQFVRPSVLKALDGAPESAHNAFNNWSAGTLPPSGASTRGTLLDVQEAASGVINKLHGKANDAFTAQIPSNAASQLISANNIKGAIAELRARAADPNYFGKLPGGGDALRSVASELENATKEAPLRVGDVNGYLKDLNAKAYKEGYSGEATRQIKDVLKSITPEYDAARGAKANFIANEVNPVKQGLAGQIANMGGGVRPDKYTASAQAINMTFPSNRLQPGEIIQLGKDAGPDVVGKLLAEHLTQAAEGSFKTTKNVGSAMQQPFDFMAQVAGTNAQRQNINAGLEVVARSNKLSPQGVQQGFFKLLKAMDTYKDLKVSSGIDKASVEQAAGANWVSAGIAPFSRAGRYVQDAVMSRTYKHIAKMVLDPAGLAQIEAIGKSGSAPQAQAFVRSIMAIEAAGEASDNKTAGLDNNNPNGK